MSNTSLPLNSSWGPVDETSTDILFDSLNLIGSTVLCGVAYGIAIPLLIQCFYPLRSQLQVPERRRLAAINLTYMLVLFILSTLYIASNAFTTQLSYVNNRNFPGGPTLYSQVIFYLPVSIMGLFAFFAINWITDIILIWRLYVVYGGQLLAKVVAFFPTVMFLGSFGMSLATLHESVVDGQSSPVTFKFVLGYYSLTMSTTILATTLLLGRILIARRRSRKLHGNNYLSTQYLSIAAVLVESSALYTVWTIVFVGLYAVGSPAQYVFLATLSGTQVIALYLILYRVTHGTAWNSNTVGELSSLEFRRNAKILKPNSNQDSGNTTRNGNEEVIEFGENVDLHLEPKPKEHTSHPA